MVANPTRSIITGHCGDVVWLSVEGPGSKENSADVVKYIEPEITEGRTRFVVDLEDCTGLDSTFMGMLLGVSKRLSRIQQGCLHIINARGRNAQLLRGLGVHYFCSLSEDCGPFNGHPNAAACECQDPDGSMVSKDAVVDRAELIHHSLSKGEQTEHCLNAHRELCSISQSNQEKFQDVVDLMGQKLRQLQQ